MIALFFTLTVFLFLFTIFRQNNKHTQIINAYKNQVEAYKKLVPDLGSVVPMSHFRDVVDKKDSDLAKTQIQLYETEQRLEDLKSKQQSKSVRLGLISENVLPFHQDFKYNVKDLVPMFRPIDYVVFSEDEIIFLEIKTGTSQLTEKQRAIKRLVESGKVRFEEHRIDESGYTIKETNGKEAESELRS
jgi:predicted Holliday junction resolvase-like endonuclease